METWIGDDGQFQWNDNVHRVLGSGQGPKRLWFAAKNSPPPRLVCGSPEDNITPVELLEKLAARIGCEKKLDFEELVWLTLQPHHDRNNLTLNDDWGSHAIFLKKNQVLEVFGLGVNVNGGRAVMRLQRRMRSVCLSSTTGWGGINMVGPWTSPGFLD